MKERVQRLRAADDPRIALQEPTLAKALRDAVERGLTEPAGCFIAIDSDGGIEGLIAFSEVDSQGRAYVELLHAAWHDEPTRILREPTERPAFAPTATSSTSRCGAASSARATPSSQRGASTGGQASKRLQHNDASSPGRDGRSEARTQGAPRLVSLGASEDTASGRAARPGGTRLIVLEPLRRTNSLWPSGCGQPSPTTCPRNPRGGRPRRSCRGGGSVLRRTARTSCPRWPRCG